jgi:all-trans-8'-apo-beta-carotenal 15,15'-oxygenase
MPVEHTGLPITQIEGTIPADLAGTLYRNGPGLFERFGVRYAHWFDGDGMVSAITVRHGQATFRNRFVRTAGYRREEQAGQLLHRGLMTQRPGPWWSNIWRQIKNTANTNVVLHAGKLLALWEAGRPHWLLPESLETMGEEDFQGALAPETFFSAHIHRDPHTGDLVAIGPTVGPNPRMRIWGVNPQGAGRLLHTIPTAQTHLMHDFGLTPSRIVLLAPPHYLEPQRLIGHLVGRDPIFNAFCWHSGEPLRIYSLDRAQGTVQTYELPTAFILHVVNTFDEGETVVMDAVEYPDSGALRLVEDIYAGRPARDAYPVVVRLRLHPNGEATREVLSTTPLEFPRINERCDGLPYQVCYGVPFGTEEILGSQVAQLHLPSQTVRTVDFGPGRYPSEAVFCPRQGGAGETDGWVLSLVYDSTDHHSFLSIMRADPFGEECARLHLPFHVPHTFHGTFVPDTA